MTQQILESLGGHKVYAHEKARNDSRGVPCMLLMGYGGPLATLTLFFCQSSLDPLANVCLPEWMFSGMLPASWQKMKWPKRSVGYSKMSIKSARILRFRGRLVSTHVAIPCWKHPAALLRTAASAWSGGYRLPSYLSPSNMRPDFEKNNLVALANRKRNCPFVQSICKKMIEND